jgi:hypothetical protein
MAPFSPIDGQDADIATSFVSEASHIAAGQRHDRFEEELAPNPSNYAVGNDGDGEVEITAAQKMISAMSGSLLTSLIGNTP